jgi:hypothetical protein
MQFRSVGRYSVQCQEQKRKRKTGASTQGGKETAETKWRRRCRNIANWAQNRELKSEIEDVDPVFNKLKS